MSGGRPTPPVALSIAGSDSGGGAGIAADLHSFAANGAFGTFALSAITAQNTRRVLAVYPQLPEVLDRQIQALLEDLPPAAAKTGMLANAQLIEVVIAHAERGALPNLVVDPVMVAASGAELVDELGRRAYKALLPHARLVTPNVAEAEVLTGVVIEDRASLADAARALCDLGAPAALVTGGHLADAQAVDVLCVAGAVNELVGAWVTTRNVHGTGCTLSAAIAARLAVGDTLEESVSVAKRFVAVAIAAAAEWSLGAGPGPLDHRLGLAPEAD